MCFFAGIAQLVEQLICNQQVAGSSPVASSSFDLANVTRCTISIVHFLVEFWCNWQVFKTFFDDLLKKVYHVTFYLLCIARVMPT